MVTAEQFDLTGGVHRVDAVGEHDACGIVAAGPVGPEEPKICFRQQVAGVGERRCPAVGATPGVPADVIGVQMGVDHHVDVLGRHPRGGQRTEEVGFQMIQRRHVPAVAAVAHTGVDQHRQSVDVHHPTLDGDLPQVDVTIPERRFQQLGVLWPGLRGCLSEQCGAHREPGLHHPGDRGGTQRDPPGHGAIRTSPGEYSPEWVLVPSSSSAGCASTIVSNRRNDPQS